MERRALLVCLCVVLFTIQLPSTNGGYCNQRVTNYYAQQYCASYWWWWCTKHAYRRAVHFYSYKKTCCLGYKGDDCLTPICNPPCASGCKCVAPNQCSGQAAPRPPQQ
ncbi:uncharacterized protein LOC111118505 [Crassostrea virginica]